jgi:phage tail sheath gpL-like
MSVLTTHERPGVYSSYEASSLSALSGQGGAVAVAAASDQADADTVYCWTSYSQALSAVGECTLSALARLALKNGAGKVYGVAGSGDYAAAFDLLAQLEDVDVAVCDSEELSVQQALAEMVKECSQARRERTAVVFGGEDETVAKLVKRAADLNCERVVLCAPGGAEAAAALAGAIAATTDPALPLSGVELAGVTPAGSYEDGDLDLLIRGGVTPLEAYAGACQVVRAVTTRTTTGGAADATWRELTTILVVDQVIPGIREALRARFSRAKNTEQTRGAIHSLVLTELEERVSSEIIDSYEDVTVTARTDDPTVCEVEFAFTVAHGLNQIWMSAHITV